MTFTLSANGGVGAWTWLDHPAGTVGYFVDTKTNVPSNGFFLIPGREKTGKQSAAVAFLALIGFIVRFVQNQALSRVKQPSLESFVIRSLWNNTHL